MNKVALVTGASRGIGRAIALQLAQDGFDVAVHYNKEKEKAYSIVQEIKNIGREAISIKADVSDVKECSRLVEAVIREFKRIDVLVNNAGIMNRNNFEDSTEEIWNQIMDTNLKSVFFLSQYVSRYMKKQKSGSIINISSIAGSMVNSSSIEYAISKAGVIHLTKSLALALAPEITVNSVAPGRTTTDITGYAVNIEKRKMREQGIPLGRVNEPEDIAVAVAFLVSDKARNITGHVLTIDGGEILKR